jgi:hypothetical protein
VQARERAPGQAQERLPAEERVRVLAQVLEQARGLALGQVPSRAA